MPHRPTVAGAAFALVMWSASAGTSPLQAQIDPWQNAPQPDTGRQVVPFMEGWYDNGDGTFTISFGYLNRNPNQVVEIPHGERNYIEPEQFNGLQPTTFHGSRDRGTFAVTIPASARDEDIWWYITPADGQTYKVPGRTTAPAYQLDWLPRPHGSVAPRVWFGSESSARQGPEGVRASETLRASVGQPVTLTVNVDDPSVRDPNDRRFDEGVPVRVSWFKYSGPPGEVMYERHPSSPEPTAGGTGSPPAADQVTLDGLRGTARVIARFPAPGEYVILARADNWGAPDSSAGDQCCWTNAYQTVVVTQ
jgi:hypothetical protein